MTFKLINTRLRIVLNGFAIYVIPILLVFFYVALIGGKSGSEPLYEQWEVSSYIYWITYFIVPALLYSFWIILKHPPTNGQIAFDMHKIDIQKGGLNEIFPIDKLESLTLNIRPAKLRSDTKNFISLTAKNQRRTFEFRIDTLADRSEILILFEQWKSINQNVKRSWIN